MAGWIRGYSARVDPVRIDHNGVLIETAVLEAYDYDPI